MASDLSIKITQLKASEKDAIEDMIHIYQEAFQNDENIQLNPKTIMSDFMDQMAKTIAKHAKQPECEYFVARDKSNNTIAGWLSLAIKLTDDKRLSEEHMLLLQYALLPDIVIKGKSHGIGTDVMKGLAHSLLKEFKEAREKQLPNNHCILSTLVVDPQYQKKGVATALLSKAIHFAEIFSLPIWVQAPEACQRLFERHSFDEVGEYRLDLNEHVPKAVGKAKTNKLPPLGKYIFKYMVRQGPLEPAIEAYKSSKVYAEYEEEIRAERLENELLEGKKKHAREQSLLGRISRVFPGAEAKLETTEPLLGEEEQWPKGKTPIATSHAEAGPSTPLLAGSKSKRGNEEQSTSGEIPIAPSHAEAGPSTPLLAESRSKRGEEEQSTSGKTLIASSHAEAGPSTPLLAESRSKGSQKSTSKEKAANRAKAP